MRRCDDRTLDLFARRLPAAAPATAPWQPPTFRVLDPAAIEVRPYFRIAFDAWSAGGNIGLVADTSMGKTYLAYALADGLLAAGQRILLTAPTSVLCEQHAALARIVFRLDADDVRFVSGTWTPKRRAGKWGGGRILIATPQTAANDLARGIFALDGIGLVVIDECHHAALTHASIAVANAAHARGSRILALTASPGGDRERIERIRTNLHLDAWVRIPEEGTQAFRPPVAETRETVPVAEGARDIVRGLGDLLERLTTPLAARGFLEHASDAPSPADLSHALTRIRTAAGALEYFPLAAAAQQVMNVLTVAVSDDYGVAAASMRRALGRTNRNGGPTKTARRLQTTPEVRAALAQFDALTANGALHPKQDALIRVIREAMAATSGQIRVLVFDRYADGCLRLVEVLRAALGVRVEVALGRARMRSEALIATLHAFGRGEFPILVGTDVIREGIHIPAVDLLAVYSPPRNERELIQLYGRVGRSDPGHITALVADHTVDLRYAFSAEARARRMQEALAAATPTTPASGADGATHRSRFTSNPEKPRESFVRALRGPFVFERFRVVEANIDHARIGRNRPFVRMLVGDRTGTVPLLHWCPKGWSQAEEIVRTYPPGTIAIVAGMYEKGRTPRIIVNPRERQGITQCPDGDYNPADYDRTPPF